MTTIVSNVDLKTLVMSAAIYIVPTWGFFAIINAAAVFWFENERRWLTATMAILCIPMALYSYTATFIGGIGAAAVTFLLLSIINRLGNNTKHERRLEAIRSRSKQISEKSESLASYDENDLKDPKIREHVLDEIQSLKQSVGINESELDAIQGETDRRIKTLTRTLVTLVILTATIYLLLVKTWLPVEAIRTKGNEERSVYVLREGGDYIVVLYTGTREVERIPNAHILDRELCSTEDGTGFWNTTLIGHITDAPVTRSC